MTDRDARSRVDLQEQIAYMVKCAAYNQPLMGVDWTRPENQRWLDVAERIIATALAEREREVEEIRASAEKYYDQMARDYVKDVIAERDAAQAEVARLREAHTFSQSIPVAPGSHVCAYDFLPDGSIGCERCLTPERRA